MSLYFALQHPLFRTLQSNHKGDTYTKCFHTSKENGPRQPWHDIHSAVRGPEVLDLIQAFSERWTKQAPQYVGELINLHRIGMGDASKLENEGGWCTQLSRSIDSRVNVFDPSIKQSFRNESVDRMNMFDWTTIKEKGAEKSNRFETASNAQLTFNRCLDQKKGRLVDSSIHMSNIHYIRRAKHFIYIESQYFMGSSFMWSNSSERDVKCSNMIAAEVCSSIITSLREIAFRYLVLFISSYTNSQNVSNHSDHHENLRQDFSEGAICSVHSTSHVDGGHSWRSCNSRIAVLATCYN